MTIHLNHTVVASKDAAASAKWFAETLGLEPPLRAGPFWQVSVANGVDLDFYSGYESDDVRSQHYAFLVDEEDFDAILERIIEQDIDYFADPQGQRCREINHNDGGRGAYFADPNGHWLEILTRPYGSQVG